MATVGAGIDKLQIVKWITIQAVVAHHPTCETFHRPHVVIARLKRGIVVGTEVIDEGFDFDGFELHRRLDLTVFQNPFDATYHLPYMPLTVVFGNQMLLIQFQMYGDRLFHFDFGAVRQARLFAFDLLYESLIQQSQKGHKLKNLKSSLFFSTDC